MAVGDGPGVGVFVIVGPPGVYVREGVNVGTGVSVGSGVKVIVGVRVSVLVVVGLAPAPTTRVLLSLFEGEAWTEFILGKAKPPGGNASGESVISKQTLKSQPAHAYASSTWL